MVDTLSGTTMLSRFMHHQNAFSPIDSMPSGIVIAFREKHSQKAHGMMEVTQPGISYSASFLPSGYRTSAFSTLSNNTPSMEVYLSLSSSTSMDINDVQKSKADAPMDATSEGINTDIKLWQPLKACSPMEVTLSGISMDSKFSHPSNTWSPMDTSWSERVIDTRPEQFINALSPM